MTDVLVTGGTGFIGAYVIDAILEQTDWNIYSVERLHNTRPESSRLRRIYHDLLAPFSIPLPDVDYVVHCGATVSGIRSLITPTETITTNVLGTQHLLDASRKNKKLKKFLFMSSGEAVGNADDVEADGLGTSAPMHPSNPYAASKAAAEVLCHAYLLSYGLPITVLRSMNVFGPKQSTDRFIPMTLKLILEGKIVKCHVGRTGTVGSRNWMGVQALATRVLYLLEHTNFNNIYHAVGPEWSNFDVIRHLAQSVNANYHVEKVVPGRSHDMRYALKDSWGGLLYNGEQLGNDLAYTARWYSGHKEWLR